MIGLIFLMRKIESDKLRERCVNSFITWHIKHWQNWLKSCCDSEIMHKNQIYANKASFKVPFSYLSETELHASVFNSSYMYSHKSTKTISLWICHYGCTMKQLWWIFPQMTKVTSFHLNRVEHVVRTREKNWCVTYYYLFTLDNVAKVMG